MKAETSDTDLRPLDIARKVERCEFSLVDTDSRSRVWLVFSRIKKPDGELVPDYNYCKSCFKVFKYNPKSTSNLVKHRCYVELIRGQEDALNDSETTTIGNDEKGLAVNNLHDNLTQLITKWIVREYQPYDLLESEGLKDIFQEVARLGSQYGTDVDVAKLLPSMSDITESIHEIYRPCFEEVKAEISACKEHGFGLTCDIRNDNLTKKNYILLTAHYIHNNTSKVRFLGIRKLEDEKWSNKHILQKIDEILADFYCNLSSLCILVTDSNNALYKNIPQIQTLPCLSQLLSNALFRSMKEIPEVVELITNCSTLVNFLARKGQENIFGDFLKKPHYNPWRATFNILHLINKSWHDIEHLLKFMNEKQQILTIKVTHLKAVVEILQPFEEALENLEDDSSPTLHLVIVYLHELKKSCDRPESEFGYLEFMEKFKAKLRNNLEKIEAENITILHKVALFLYPLTKKLLQYNDKEKKLVEDECLRLMQNYKCEMRSVVKQEPGSPCSSPASKRQKLLCDFIEPEDPDPNELLNQEIEFYKSARVVNISDFNVFNWWQMQQDNFPNLCKLYYTVLATPATCAASKRTFSAGSSLFTGKSTQLTKEADLEKIIFINSNARPGKW